MHILFKAPFRDSPPTFLRIFGYFFVAIMLTVVAGFVTYPAFCTFDNPNQVDYGRFWFEETPIPKLMIIYFVRWSVNLVFVF
jgi:hypothetical protein